MTCRPPCDTPLQMARERIARAMLLIDTDAERIALLDEARRLYVGAGWHDAINAELSAQIMVLTCEVERLRVFVSERGGM